MKTQYTAEEALQRLKDGNARYISSTQNPGDVSQHVREETYVHGQHPYATVIACSDSREIPEAIFSCGIGEIFAIRVAGNVINETQLGSIEYAADHLGVPLTVVLGHTNCGAVGAALEGHTDGHVGVITKDIIKAVKGTVDPTAASRRNAMAQAERIRTVLREHCGFRVVSALYHIENGTIEWLD
ncbi:MAG: hypothetical protein K6G61_12845 [Solobacterium sp.]|nr:hypothetical protein [Solobacterium sp.]